jgi:hypothetical protein
MRKAAADRRKQHKEDFDPHVQRAACVPRNPYPAPDLDDPDCLEEMPAVTLCHNLSRHWTLNGLVMFTIIVCAVCDGLATYPGFEDHPYLNHIDTGAVVIFLVEMAIKIAGHGTKPWRYLIGLEYLRKREILSLCCRSKGHMQEDHYDGEDPFEDDGTDDHLPKPGTKAAHTEQEYLWNCFDSIIISICVIQLLGIGGNMSSLRLLRVLRVTRLLNQITALRAIMSGLVSGMKVSSPILGLSGFIFFLFANIGVDELDTNDPLHFLNMKHAVWTLYRLTTMDWLTVCYTAIYGCEVYRGAGYTVFVNSTDPASTGLLQELRAIGNYFESYKIVNKPEYAYSTYHYAVLATAADDTVPNIEHKMLASEQWCLHEPNLPVGVCFFISFTLVSGLIIVTLFTGAVSLSMTTDMHIILEEDKARRMKEEEEELFGAASADPVQKARQKRIDKAFLNRNDDDRCIIGLRNGQQKNFLRGQIYVHWVRMHLGKDFMKLSVGTGKVAAHPSSLSPLVLTPPPPLLLSPLPGPPPPDCPPPPTANTLSSSHPGPLARTLSLCCSSRPPTDPPVPPLLRAYAVHVVLPFELSGRDVNGAKDTDLVRRALALLLGDQSHQMVQGGRQ